MDYLCKYNKLMGIRKVKLLDTKLEKNIVKRAFFLYTLFTVAALVLCSHKYMFIMGLTAGSAFGVLRFASYAKTFSRILSPDKVTGSAFRSICKVIINLALTVLLLVISLKFSQWMFFGVLAGTSAIPLAIVFNAVTEALGITNNNFE